MKRQQSGFTLIELIIVIVILGILAITAAPRFFDFGGDARKSTLSGVKGALESASALVYGKALIAGLQTGDACLTVDGKVEAVPNGGCDPALNLVNGYPAADVSTLKHVAELSDVEWSLVLDNTSNVVTIRPKGFAPANPTDCRVTFAASAGAGQKPVIAIDDNGC